MHFLKDSQVACTQPSLARTNRCALGPHTSLSSCARGAHAQHGLTTKLLRENW